MLVDLQGEGEVLSHQWCAILPREAGPEPVRRLHAPIGEHPPALRVELRQLLGQIRARLAAVVE